MFRSSRLKSLSALGAMALLNGCAVGPDFAKPEAPKEAGYAPHPLPAAADQQSFAAGKDVRFDWWREFGSPQLDRLVQEALAHNPSIPAALASLRQAQEQTYAQQGSLFPSISADYNFERQQLAGNQGGNSPGIQGNGNTISTYQNPSGPAPFNGPVIFNMHTAQLQVAYNPDVLGGNRRQIESLTAQAEQQRFLLQAAYVTLIDNVVAAAILEAATRDQIAATRALIADNAKSLEILKSQSRFGYAAAMDVANAEAALAQSETQLPPLEKQLQQTRDQIRALVGKLPSEETDEITGLASLKLPAELPLSLPSKIVEQRPDVRAAEEQVRSANAQVGVAIAARLPQFSLSGTAGGVASQFGQMFSTGGPFWTMVGDVAMPIFDGNTLLHRERAADQALIQANEQYRATVIGAYQNVADSLHALLADADAVKATAKSEASARKVLDITRSYNQAGQVDWLTLYAADLNYQQAVVASTQAKAQRFTDTAALYQALGGGWWNRPEAKSENTEGDFLLDAVKWVSD